MAATASVGWLGGWVRCCTVEETKPMKYHLKHPMWETNPRLAKVHFENEMRELLRAEKEAKTRGDKWAASDIALIEFILGKEVGK